MAIIKNDYPVYTIQESGLISNPDWAEGRMIPAVILNSRQNSDLKDFIKTHTETNIPGDAIVQWGWPISIFSKTKTWELMVKFVKPMELTFNIEFVLEKHYSLIDAIFHSRGLYIAYGYVGEKLSKSNHLMVLVEIPDTETDQKWNSTLSEIIKNKLKRKGVNKKNLKNEVKISINNGREILKYRKDK